MKTGRWGKTLCGFEGRGAQGSKEGKTGWKVTEMASSKGGEWAVGIGEADSEVRAEKGGHRPNGRNWGKRRAMGQTRETVHRVNNRGSWAEKVKQELLG